MSLMMSYILILLALSWQIKLLIFMLIVTSASYAVCTHGLLLLPWCYVAMTINVNNELRLKRRDGLVSIDQVICDDSVVTPYLTVIHFRKNNTGFLRQLFTQHQIILPDRVDAESYRQLRVWLRWGRTMTPS